MDEIFGFDLARDKTYARFKEIPDIRRSPQDISNSASFCGASPAGFNLNEVEKATRHPCYDLSSPACWYKNLVGCLHEKGPVSTLYVDRAAEGKKERHLLSYESWQSGKARESSTGRPRILRERVVVYIFHIATVLSSNPSSCL